MASQTPEPAQQRNPPSPLSRDTPSPSPRPAPSLQAAATVNAGLYQESSRNSSSTGSLRNRYSPQQPNPHRGRRRSSVLMQLQLTDPSIPGPGELATDTSGAGHSAGSPLMRSGSPRTPPILGRDPLQRGRTTSLGELHQDMEAETEAHVNRLLQIIQQQQLQISQLQGPGQGQGLTQFSGAGGEATPPAAFPALTPSSSLPRSPVRPRGSFDLARTDLPQRRSRTPSRGASPRLRSTSISGESGEPLTLGGRDESAFYQAETQMLTRENQMLRHRIRELEYQLTILGGHQSTAAVTHEPFQHSHLTHSTSATQDEGTEADAALAQPSPPAPAGADPSSNKK